MAEFAPEGDATCLTSSMAFQPKGVFVVLTPVMRSQLAKQLDQAHQALKPRLESRG